jgi:hypothetical protein
MGAFTRSFVVRTPAPGDARTPGALIFLFHPFGMNAQYISSSSTPCSTESLAATQVQ